VISNVRLSRRAAIFFGVLMAIGLSFFAAFAVSPAHADAPTGFSNTVAPSISGTLTVGSTLTANPGTWTPTPDSFSYSWTRFSGGSAGVTVATTTTYQLTNADGGASIELLVTAHKAGFIDATANSSSSGQVAGASMTKGTPVISGTLAVGSTLTVNPGTWSPSNAVFQYSWFRNGNYIQDSGVNTYSQSYVVSARDAGQKLSVYVTADAAGYTETSTTSNSVQIPGTGYTVSGTLTAIQGSATAATPLQNILVEVFAGYDEVGYDYTDSNGHYEIDFGSATPSTVYSIDYNDNTQANSPGRPYVHQWLGGVPDQQDARTFTLSSSNPSEVDSFQLAQAATVTGTVVDSSGNPISGIYVSATTPNGLGGSYATTGADGTYTLTQVSAAETIAEASGAFLDSSARDSVFYNPQYWSNAATQASATPLSITAGATTPNINFTLSAGPSISGRVVDSSGNGVSEMGYYPEVLDPATNTWDGPQYGPIITDAQGYFKERAVAGSTYRFGFSDDYTPDTNARTTPYNNTWYSGASSLATATNIPVTSSNPQVTLGNIIVTPHTGAPTYDSTPYIQLEPGATDGSLEIVGIAVSPGVATPAFQWNRDGTAIPNATRELYTPVAADSGHQLTVTVVSTFNGQSATITSTPWDLRTHFSSTANPVISGTAAVGSPLTVSTGTLTPTPTSVSYQWLRTTSANVTSVISGAATSSYTPVAADVGNTISAIVTSSSSGYVDFTATSASTGSVQNGTLTPVTPTISGTAAVGQTLTATAPSWGSGVALTEEWFSGLTDTGVSGLSYPLTANDRNATLSVRVTGTEPGYTTLTSSSASTAAVGPGTLAPVPPTISGTAAVGNTLTATATSWGAGVTVSGLEWFRNGTDTTVSGATYSLTPADLGAVMTVQDSGSATGYTSATATSAQTAAIAAGTLTPVKPTIAGTAAVGKTLTATATSWGAGVTVSGLEWYRNGVDTTVSGTSYVLSAADQGSVMTVRDSGSETGYATTTATSDPTATVGPGTLTPVQPTISGTAAVGSTLTATAPSWGSNVTLTLEWFSGGADTGVSGTTYTPIATDRTNAITVVVTGTRSGYTTATSTSAATSPVVYGTLTPVAPTISGTAAVGKALTGSATSWGAGVSVSTLEWFRNGTDTNVSGAAYSLTSADQGAVITVQDSGSEPGYTTATATSAGTSAVVAGTLSPVAPTISGTAKVGQVLTATAPSWGPGVTLSLEWFSGGIDTGISGNSYTVGTSDQGATIAVVATGTQPGYTSATATSTATATVGAGTLTPQTPTISGTAKVGQTLTATAPSWGSNVTVSLEWFSGKNDTGFSGSTYKLVASDLGATMTVVATGSQPGYTTASAASAPTATVVAGTLTPVQPTISGTAAVGATLTATAPSWGTNVALTLEWFSGSADTGVSGTTYTPTAGDRTNAITVVVTGSRPGYTTATSTSAATSPVVNGTLTPVAPTISGTAAVGQTLTTTAPSWGNGVTVSLEWYSNGTDTGISGTSYPLTFNDKGNVLTVKATGSEVGYTTSSATSAPTAAVAAGTLTPVQPTISGTAAVGKTLTATAPSWGPNVGLTLEWFSGTADTGDSTTTYTPVAGDRTNVITVVVTGSRPGYTTATSTSAATSPVVNGTLTPVAPTISGTPTVGKTLTATAPSWGSGPTVTLEWFSAGVDTYSSGTTYTVAPGDLGNQITVVATGTQTGYTTATQSSAPTAKVAAGTLTSTTPTISGSPTFGNTLTAVSPASGWGPGTVIIGLQWLRDGVAIPGQTGTTYSLAATDVGHAISVQATGTEIGYTTLVATSSAVTIAPAVFTATPTPTMSVPSAIQHRISAGTSGWTPTPDSFTYLWYRDGISEPGASDDPSKYQLTPADFGHTITLAVVAIKAGYTSVTTPKSAPSAPVQAFQPVFTNSVAPTVTGDYVVGSQLTAVNGTWDPSPDNYSWVWARGTGDPNAGGYTNIPNATNDTYTLQPADAGLSVIVRVTANKSGYTPKTLITDESDPVADGTLTAGSPTITGTAQVGAPLTVVTGTWTPGVTFEYKWMNGSNPVPLQDSSSPTYTPVVADLGDDIFVKVVGTEAGYNQNIQVTPTTLPVAKGQFATPVPLPTITGSAKAGSTLGVSTAAWSPATGFSYQWNLAGQPISGATNSTFVPSAADATQTITVTITSVLNGYAPTSETSPGATVAKLNFTTIPKPTISGTAQVGHVLTAAHGTWAPAPTDGIDFSYIWRVAGVVRSTATGPTYAITSADLGHSITVNAVASAAGFPNTPSPTSSATRTVIAGTFVSVTPRISDTTPGVGERLTVIAGTWQPAPSAVHYQWYRGSTAIKGATGAAYTATTADYGHSLKASIVGSRAGYTSVKRTTASTHVTGKGTIITVRPTISGTVAVGHTIAVAHGNWSPAPTAYSYQWYRSGVAVKGSTKTTYALTTSDFGHAMTVKVTGSRRYFVTVAANGVTGAVAAGTLVALTPRIAGTATLNATLTAVPGPWTPTPTFTYQWFRAAPDGGPMPITGATGSTYKVTSADVGDNISVLVTGHRTAYATQSQASEPTAAVTGPPAAT
jgi:hypothetical protein